MQRPTLTNVRIRSTHDAHLIFHAVSVGILNAIHRRLDADERAALSSGCVYAWEERGQHTEVTGLGIERFTEGRRWGPSRVRDEFLFYYEKSPPQHIREKDSNMLVDMRHREWDPLVKQTYSVWVEGPKGRRKWHLTAYFTQSTVDQLQTIDDVPHIANLEFAASKYISTRLGKPRAGRQDVVDTHSRNAGGTEGNNVHDVFRNSGNASVTRTYAPFPLPLPYEVTPPGHSTTSTQPSLHSHSQSPIAHAGHNDHGASKSSVHNNVNYHSSYGAPPPIYPPRQPPADGQLTLPPLHALEIPGTGPHGRYAVTPLSAHASPQHHIGPSAVHCGVSNYHNHQHCHSGFSGQQRQHASPTVPSSQGQQQQPYYPPTPTSLPSTTPGGYSSPAYPSAHGTYTEHHYDRYQPNHLQHQYIQQSPPHPHDHEPVNQLHPDAHGSGYNHVSPSYSYQHDSGPSQSRSLPLPVRLDPSSSNTSPSCSGSFSSAIEGQNQPSSASRSSSVCTSDPESHYHRSSSGGVRYLNMSTPGSSGRDSAVLTTLELPSLSPISSIDESVVGGTSGKRLDLAPLRALTRPHPYRRDKFDDNALKAFSGRRNSFD